MGIPDKCQPNISASERVNVKHERLLARGQCRDLAFLLCLDKQKPVFTSNYSMAFGQGLPPR